MSSDQPSLTPREHEILERIAAGLTDAEIAKELGIGRRTTVTGHVGDILGKFGVRTRSGAVALAVARGLVCVHESNENP